MIKAYQAEPPDAEQQLGPDVLALVDAVAHQHGVVSVGLELVPGARVVGAGQHQRVQRDRADVLLHLRHPHLPRCRSVITSF